MAKKDKAKVQASILAFIKKYLDKNGLPPTRKEIAAHMGWSSANAAQLHLKDMEKSKMVRLMDDTARGIRVL
jgi:repressor LexA